MVRRADISLVLAPRPLALPPRFALDLDDFPAPFRVDFAPPLFREPLDLLAERFSAHATFAARDRFATPVRFAPPRLLPPPPFRVAACLRAIRVTPYGLNGRP